ncbi:uncharacterized protein LOC100216559 [Zea mays]|uniref:Uncharacterized protein n=1 Tax=Zea mays TaxID=4577 RepID=B4FIL6_MAIZE|nr:uncharacterized protein LOC100216559 [Zea mays]ACF81959.1 unknown [Zea mays]|eukprot:NP_001136451.1 uncharacterized protein LOC100216559 [Zea mays]
MSVCLSPLSPPLVPLPCWLQLENRTSVTSASGSPTSGHASSASPSTSTPPSTTPSPAHPPASFLGTWRTTMLTKTKAKTMGWELICVHGHGDLIAFWGRNKKKFHCCIRDK